jgi:hypothetical protein
MQHKGKRLGGIQHMVAKLGAEFCQLLLDGIKPLAFFSL